MPPDLTLPPPHPVVSPVTHRYPLPSGQEHSDPGQSLGTLQQPPPGALSLPACLRQGNRHKQAQHELDTWGLTAHRGLPGRTGTEPPGPHTSFHTVHSTVTQTPCSQPQAYSPSHRNILRSTGLEISSPSPTHNHSHACAPLLEVLSCSSVGLQVTHRQGSCC